MEEIHFLVDETLEENRKELEQILFEIKNPELEKNVFVLRSFARAVAFALKKEIPKIEKEVISEIMRIPRGIEVYPVPVPTTEKAKAPLYEYKAVPKYEKKVIKKVVPKRKNLIIDKITSKILASAKVNEKYVVTEPVLDETDLKVLKRVKEKNPKDMEEGWNLIKKFGERLKIKEGHDTDIKYYLANELFAFGKIEPFLHDQNIKTIICDGPGELIKVAYDGKLLKSNLMFKDKEELRDFIFDIAKKANKKINEEEPILDVVIRNYRVHCTLGIAGTGSRFTIKKIE